MRKSTENNINEAYENIKQYLDDEESTKDLREMCQNCEKYCGEQHDFEECEDLICFKFWLAYEYLEWSNGYGG